MKKNDLSTLAITSLITFLLNCAANASEPTTNIVKLDVKAFCKLAYTINGKFYSYPTYGVVTRINLTDRTVHFVTHSEILKEKKLHDLKGHWYNESRCKPIF